ncbi:MAG: hypothetical protein J0H92_10260 [Sphingobacteriales bacterium]|jgi:hypothetical protein|nr:hypothetical protein [Sphingobacteriales bacterium]NCT74595.1 hypothetical protein [Chitinophagaceae bacterium]OJW32371.1 MAG: hypothetical protein BGO54_18405 [Sphingobacteriales bacterium 46-32]
MNERHDIEQRIGRALESLDGMKRAQPAPWFYTRLRARLERDEPVTVWEHIGSFLSRPAVVVAGLCVILVANVTILLKQPAAATIGPNTVAQSETVVESESLIASSSSFDYENFAP